MPPSLRVRLSSSLVNEPPLRAIRKRLMAEMWSFATNAVFLMSVFVGIEFTIESCFELVDYIAVEVEFSGAEVFADKLSTLEVRENLIDARRHIANSVVFIRLNSDFMWLFGIFVVVYCDDGCDRFTTYLHSVYPCPGFILVADLVTVIYSVNQPVLLRRVLLFFALSIKRRKRKAFSLY